MWRSLFDFSFHRSRGEVFISYIELLANGIFLAHGTIMPTLIVTRLPEVPAVINIGNVLNGLSSVLGSLITLEAENFQHSSIHVLKLFVFPDSVG